MLAPQQPNMIRILNLQGHKQTNGLKRVEALIDVVAQKDVLHGFHLFLVGEAEVGENVEEVLETAVQGTDDFCGGAGQEQAGLLGEDFAGLLAQADYLVAFEGEQGEVF